MELDGKGKKALQELGDAVNAAVEQSPIVAAAMDDLRRMGYEPNISLKLEIDLQEILGSNKEFSEEGKLHLTDDDLRTLQRMKIKLDE